MKKLLGAAGILLAVVIAAAAGFVAVLAIRKPDLRPPSAEAVARTPERIARGKYLVENVSDCYGCHADRIAQRYGLPVMPGTATNNCTACATF